MDRWFTTKLVSVALVAAVTLVGCATIGRSEGPNTQQQIEQIRRIQDIPRHLGRAGAARGADSRDPEVRSQPIHVTVTSRRTSPTCSTASSGVAAWAASVIREAPASM
jgi:hypothetical protein